MEDNNKKDPSLMVDEWLKEIMAKLDLPDQSETKAGDLGADEHAIASAGLTHPDDMECPMDGVLMHGSGSMYPYCRQVPCLSTCGWQ